MVIVLSAAPAGLVAVSEGIAMVLEIGALILVIGLLAALAIAAFKH